MNVVVLIDGREAVPVRAVPLLTNWEVVDAMTLVEAMAGLDDDFDRSFRGLVAYRVEEGQTKAVKAIWWENSKLPELRALGARLRADQDANLITHEVKKERWRLESLPLLPRGVFVWKDELDARFQREYQRDKWSFLTEELVWRSREDAEERTRPDFDPFLSDDLGAVVMAGFERVATHAPKPAESFEDQMYFAEGLAVARLGDHVWREWKSHPIVSFKHAVWLLSYIDPDNHRGKEAPESMISRLRNILKADRRERSLMDWLRDCERSQVDWGQPAAAEEPVPAEALRGDPATDPARRLALLRELGGNVTWIAGEWSVSGISLLIEREKGENRGRISPKTVRDDLKKAAQEERDAKRSGAAGGGVFPGIGR